MQAFRTLYIGRAVRLRRINRLKRQLRNKATRLNLARVTYTWSR
jgi:hypothetical protein